MKYLTLFSCLIGIISSCYGQFTAVAKDGSEEEFAPGNIADYLKSASYNAEAKFVLYIYSILPESTSLYTEYEQHLPSIVEAYKAVEDNFVLLNVNKTWELSLESEAIAGVADVIADNLVKLINAGLKASSIEIVGFSMGGKIAGWAGKKVQELTGDTVKIPSIILLGSSKIAGVRNVDVHDAEFVMTIRTESRFSDPMDQGDANFLFNRELQMPQCFFRNFGFYDHRCGSERAQLIWAEAVGSKRSDIFPGVKCENMEEYSSNRCANNEVGYFNPLVSHNLRGDFYVETTEEPRNGPFHKDLNSDKDEDAL